MVNVVSLEKARDCGNELARTEGGAGREPKRYAAAACRRVCAACDGPSMYGVDRSQVDVAVRAKILSACEALPAILCGKGDCQWGVADRPLHGAVPGHRHGRHAAAGADAVVISWMWCSWTRPPALYAPGSAGQSCHARGTMSGPALVRAAGRRCWLGNRRGGGVGLSYLPVWPSLKVVILSTGDDLVAADASGRGQAPPGNVFDVNGPMLAAAVQAEGIAPLGAGSARPAGPACRRARPGADGSRRCVIYGGSSAGARDYVAETIQRRGRRGAAAWSGRQRQTDGGRHLTSKLVIGLPGHRSPPVHVSGAVRPLLSGISGQHCADPDGAGPDNLPHPVESWPRRICAGAAATGHAGSGHAGSGHAAGGNNCGCSRGRARHGWPGLAGRTAGDAFRPDHPLILLRRVSQDRARSGGTEAFSLTEVSLIGEWRKEAILCNRLI